MNTFCMHSYSFYYGEIHIYIFGLVLWYLVFYGLGCATIVTTTDDEGLKYNNGSWQYLQAWRINKQGSLRLNDRWTGVIPIYIC